MIQRSDPSDGLVPKELREKAETWNPNHPLLIRVATAIQEEQVRNPKASSFDLAYAAIGALGTIAQRMHARFTLIAQSAGKPICALCGLRIFLDENVPHHAALTVDHIVRIADGGKTELANLQLAHSLCNAMKTAKGKNSEKKFLIMKAHIMKRLEEEKMAPSYTG